LPSALPYAPSQIREILSFKTDVRRSPYGEHRDSLRPATQELRLTFRVLPAVSEVIQNLLRSNYADTWQVPLWQDHQQLSGTYSSSETYFDVSTNADYVADGSAIIWSGSSTYEIGAVSSVDASPEGITLSSGITGSYADPIVAPVGLFYLTGVRATRSYAFDDIEVSLRRIDNRDLANLSWDTVSGTPEVSGHGVVVSPLDAGVARVMDLIQNDFGGIASVAEESQAYYRSSVSFAASTRSERWALKQNLHWLRGRDQAFYLDSLRDTGRSELHRLDSDQIEIDHRWLGIEFLMTCTIPTIEVLE